MLSLYQSTKDAVSTLCNAVFSKGCNTTHVYGKVYGKEVSIPLTNSGFLSKLPPQYSSEPITLEQAIREHRVGIVRGRFYLKN